MIPLEYECVNGMCALHYDQGTEDFHTVDEKINHLINEQSEIKKTLDFIRDTMVKADTTISKVASEVMPAVEEVMKSPMLKMLGVGKKK